MTDFRYRRDDAPPSAGPRFKLHRLKASQSFNVSIFGTWIHGFWTHWSGRTSPCSEPREECPGCKAQEPQRWKGYLHCQRDDNLEEGFLEVTKIGKEKVLALVGGDKFLRGSRLKVLRGKGDKAQLQFMLLRPYVQEFQGADMPGEVDPEETLRILFEWGNPRKDRRTEHAG